MPRMADELPQLRVIAGPNGSGKTTFVRKFLPRYVHIPHFVNADLIAAWLSPFAPEQAALRAGRLMLEEIRRLADARQDFAFETTLSGRGYEPMLRQFRNQGYQIFIYFLWLPDVSMNLARVAGRVKQGGHHVPDEDVRRRYSRGIGNFLRIYRPWRRTGSSSTTRGIGRVRSRSRWEPSRLYWTKKGGRRSLREAGHEQE